MRNAYNRQKRRLAGRKGLKWMGLSTIFFSLPVFPERNGLPVHPAG